MLPRFVKVIHDKHGISSDLVKEIVGKLADPIMIIRSTGLADPIAVFGSNSVAGRLVFMVDVTDANGATVVLPVQLDATKNKDSALIHIVTSAYSKENNGVPNNQWFEKQAKNLRYVNRKKEARWVVAAGSNSLWDVSNTLTEKSILTEKDLGKLKESFPGMYQSAVTPRARVLFGISDACAVVEFFKAADPSSAPHERYHIFRRIMSELYEDPKASEASRERYRRACAFVGTKPGRAWTPEQEERFARAGVSFGKESLPTRACAA